MLMATRLFFVQWNIQDPNEVMYYVGEIVLLLSKTTRVFIEDVVELWYFIDKTTNWVYSR